MEKSQLEKDLEKIFTIDGRGTPKKCKFLLELINQKGINEVIDAIGKMSRRKF